MHVAKGLMDPTFSSADRPPAGLLPGRPASTFTEGRQVTRQTQFFERFIHRLGGSPSGEDAQPSDVFRSFAQTVERRLTADRAPGPKVRLPAAEPAGRRSAR